jgi:hypothetical protein
VRRRFPRRARLAVALAAAAGAIITLAAMAGPGSAERSPTTLHLLATAQKGIGFSPDHKPSQGDRFGGGARITGDETGINRSVCTVIGKRALCTIQLELSKGKLSAQGLVPDQADHTPIVITGGTGAYSGAGGKAVATQISPTKTRFTVRLRR